MATTSAGGSPSAARADATANASRSAPEWPPTSRGVAPSRPRVRASVADSLRSPNGGDWLTVMTVPGRVAALERRHRRLVRHREGVLVEGGGGEGLGPGALGRP